MSKINPLFFCLLALLCTAKAALAQPAETTESDRWYQIEVFIYANSNPAAAFEETWPTELSLKYSEPLVMLTEPDDLPSIDVDTQNINSGPDLLAAQPAAAPTVPMPEAFLVLDEKDQQLNAIARNILRQADFRPLFHKAWRQALNDRNNSENILILGGEQFDQHYELEGTINISVERYLHISTNLWFSTFTSNIAGDENPWPVLPAVPALRTDNHADLSGQSPGAMANRGLFTNTPYSNSLSLGSEFQALTGNQYSVERTVGFRQHRRMRSNELHYLDHPLLGMLVKITPYEIAEAEQPEGQVP